MASFARLRRAPAISIPERPVISLVHGSTRTIRTIAVAAHQMGHNATRDNSKMLFKDAAKVGLITILKAIAATKLYQARTVRAVASSTLLVMHAVAPNVEQQHRHTSNSPSPSPPASTDSTDTPHPTTNSNPSPSPITMPTIPTPDHPASTHNASPPPPHSHPVRTPATSSRTMLEAAIWTDEVRQMQARHSLLLAELQRLCAALATPTATPTTHMPSTSSPIATRPAPQAEVYFVSSGPEFCGLTCQIESSPDVDQLRTNLKQLVQALAAKMALRDAFPHPSTSITDTLDASNGCVGSPGPYTQVARMSSPGPHFLDRVLDVPSMRATPAPAAGDGAADVGVEGGVRVDEGQQLRDLERQWNATAQEVTHLLVRLAVAKQLPAQPKQRITVSHVKEQVINHLYERLTALATM